MMRFGASPVIFLVNNRGYAIEILIHDGPYNRIQNWDYTGARMDVQCTAAEVQCSAVQCSAVQCSAVQCSAVQCSAVQCTAAEVL
jgi:TPP-dependent 2-oxoacid decarboxylase